MNILSLFDGMSCGRIAAERAGLKVDKYYASEVDKHAIKVSQANWPDIVHLGDVTKWREWQIDWASIDLLIGGSPCQGFSFAGKQLAFDDPRSALFFVYVDILNHIRSVNPEVKFMLENNRMKTESLNVISDYLGVKPVLFPSSAVSAQNRFRNYWANWEIKAPSTKGPSLSDVISSVGVIKLPLPKGFELKKKSKTLRCGGLGSKLGDRHEWDSPIKIIGEHTQESFDYCNKIRYSVTEMEAIQGIPIGYCHSAPCTQIKKMIGNAWQIDTISCIFSQIKQPIQSKSSAA